jgi:hypothetical protein
MDAAKRVRSWCIHIFLSAARGCCASALSGGTVYCFLSGLEGGQAFLKSRDEFGFDLVHLDSGFMPFEYQSYLPFPLVHWCYCGRKTSHMPR